MIITYEGILLCVNDINYNCLPIKWIKKWYQTEIPDNKIWFT